MSPQLPNDIKENKYLHDEIRYKAHSKCGVTIPENIAKHFPWRKSCLSQLAMNWKDLLWGTNHRGR